MIEPTLYSFPQKEGFAIIREGAAAARTGRLSPAIPPESNHFSYKITRKKGGLPNSEGDFYRLRLFSTQIFINLAFWMPLRGAVATGRQGCGYRTGQPRGGGKWRRTPRGGATLACCHTLRAHRAGEQEYEGKEEIAAKCLVSTAHHVSK